MYVIETYVVSGVSFAQFCQTLSNITHFAQIHPTLPNCAQMLRIVSQIEPIIAKLCQFFTEFAQLC